MSRLLAAGASVAGLAKLDQLAYSLIGNAGEGTAPLRWSPARFTGGSSSGPAAAVAAGVGASAWVPIPPGRSGFPQARVGCSVSGRVTGWSVPAACCRWPRRSTWSASWRAAPGCWARYWRCWRRPAWPGPRRRPGPCTSPRGWPGSVPSWRTRSRRPRRPSRSGGAAGCRKSRWAPSSTMTWLTCSPGSRAGRSVRSTDHGWPGTGSSWRTTCRPASSARRC